MFTTLSAVCDSRIAYRVLQRGEPFYMKRGCVCGMGEWDSVQWITWECYHLNGKRKCVTRLTDLLGTGPVFYPAVTGTGTSHRAHSDGTEYICLHSQKAECPHGDISGCVSGAKRTETDRQTSGLVPNLIAVGWVPVLNSPSDSSL